jgi:sulfur carrier protein
MIQLTINGEIQHFDNTISAAQLIDFLSLQGKRIAIERNGEIIPRSQFTDQILVDGDQLEVVVAVGGG